MLRVKRDSIEGKISIDILSRRRLIVSRKRELSSLFKILMKLFPTPFPKSRKTICSLILLGRKRPINHGILESAEILVGDSGKSELLDSLSRHFAKNCSLTISLYGSSPTLSLKRRMTNLYAIPNNVLSLISSRQIPSIFAHNTNHSREDTAHFLSGMSITESVICSMRIICKSTTRILEKKLNISLCEIYECNNTLSTLDGKHGLNNLGRSSINPLNSLNKLLIRERIINGGGDSKNHMIVITNGSRKLIRSMKIILLRVHNSHWNLINIPRKSNFLRFPCGKMTGESSSQTVPS